MGLWAVFEFFWDRNSINAEVISLNDQEVSMCVGSEKGRTWFLMIVYMSPNPIYHLELWEYLTRMRAPMNAPGWLLRTSTR